MKNKILFTILALLSFLADAGAEVDTLYHYNPNSTKKYLSTATVYSQIARFEPRGPGYIKSILVGLDGTEASSVRLHLFGQDGGTSFPQLEKDLITPIKVQKTKSGFEKVQVDLPQAVYMANNQFFVVIDSIKNGAKLASDNTAKAATCKSSDGGNYYYQYQKIQGSSPPFYPNNSWTAGANAFIIDVVIDYTYSSAPAHFEDITYSAGIDTNLSNKSIAWADFNKDNKLDLLVAGKLYKNLGENKFTDVTVQSGLSGAPQANAFIDMNNDGRTDILFLGVNDGTKLTTWLFLSADSNKFTKISLDDLPELRAVSSFSIGDIDKDGFPDLFVGQLWAAYPDALPNYLFFNNKNNGFTDKSSLLYPGNPLARRSRGSAFVDFDNDGDLDLYVTNYFLEPDEFYRNNGNGTFTDILALKNIDQNASGSNHGTGCDWADFDSDGDMDLLLPQFSHPWGKRPQYDHRGTTVYKNTGAPSYNFTDTDGSNGIEYEETHAGAAWGDANNDGLMDFIVTTYYGCRYIDFYQQKPDHTFEIKSYEYGIDKIVTGEDATWVDFDNDGKLDMACGKNYRFRLYKNRQPMPGNWALLDLVSTSGNSQAIGAKVIAYYDGKPHMQEVTAGRGQKMQKPARLHFGMGNTFVIDSVVVNWPSGQNKKEVFKNLAGNNLITLTEGGNITVGVEDNHNKKGNQLDISIQPNPAQASAQLTYILSEAINDVVIEVTNMKGQLVHTHKTGKSQPGTYTYTWSGEGAKNAAGVYFMKVKAGKHSAQKKFVFIP